MQERIDRSVSWACRRRRSRGVWLASSIAILLLPSLPAMAGDYRSGFDLAITVPDVWLVLTQDEVARHADAFLGGGSDDGGASGRGARSRSEPSPDASVAGHEYEEEADASASVGSGETSVLHAIPPEMRREVFQRIQDGELEIFYRREGQSGTFIDNVNLMLQLTALPESKEQLDSVCAVLPSEFSRVFGRPVGLDSCEVRDMVGRRALYLQFDGAVAGTKTMQYQIQRAPNVTLVLTATASNANVARMLSEFEAMVSSIRFD